MSTETMLPFDESDLTLLLQDATELARLLDQGALTSERLTQLTLAAIETLDPQINSYIAVDPEGALAAARASDLRRKEDRLLSPLDGLTLGVKDNIDVAGMVTTGGLGIPADTAPAASDAFVVSRLRAAGCVIIGKLNLHEAALGATNDNPHHGKCRNPHRLSHTPGGSSGGSGAAVAAGLCAFALGTDTMGSVRIPASYCGVSGIKPSIGAVSIGGTQILSRRLDNIGPLARSPRDLQRILPLMCAQDPASAQSRSVMMDRVGAEPGNLTFAVIKDLAEWGVAAEIQQRFTDACAVFSAAGASMLEVSAVHDSDHFDPAAARRGGLLVCEADLLVHEQERLAAHPEYYSPGLKKMLDWAAGKSAADLVAADLRLDAAAVVLTQLLGKRDFLLMPTTPQSAFDFSEPVPAGQADLTNMANMSGHPAVSVPMGRTSDGLPLGLQIIGRHGSDLQLLQLASWFSDQRDTKASIPADLAGSFTSELAT